MFFILSKITSFLFKPLSWILTILLLSLLPRFASKRRNMAMMVLAIFYLTGHSVLINELCLLWEPEPLVTSDSTNQVPSSKVCVILGGYSGFDHERNRVGFTEASERLFYPLQNILNHQIDTVILTGGSASIVMKKYYESTHIAQYLKDYGVKPNRIFIDAKSRNTYENAVETKKILDSLKITEPVLLVTSAFHMPRSKGCFDKAGVKYIAYPVHYMGNATRDYNLEAWLIPSTGAMETFQTLFREVVGMISYKVTGKI
ncbi:MAG: YdcF family protein [Bacteroidota bacterium]